MEYLSPYDLMVRFKMSSNTLQILEPAIYITEERDRRSLEKALLETLSELFSFETVILLQIPKNSKHKYIEPVLSVPVNACHDKLKLLPAKFGEKKVEIDEWMFDSINFCKPIKTSFNGSPRAIFPLIINKVITGLLDIYGYQDNSETDSAIIALTRIYSNFIAILQDSEHDTLTGLLNRKTFDRRLAEIFSDQDSMPSITENQNINPDIKHWIGIMDIDHFKRVNDTFGHLYGDEVLLLFSGIMQKTFSNNELLFRFGGEEFVVILLNVTETEAVAKFEKFRKNIEEFTFPQVGQVTVSIGVAKINEEIHITTLLEQIDKALYYAKEHGRNQVCNYDELISKGLLSERKINNDIDLF